MGLAIDTVPCTDTLTVDLFDDTRPFRLECGKSLGRVTVAYETYGTLNAEGTNAMLVCHALTANAHAAGFSPAGDPSPGWWDGLIGPGKALDPTRYYIVSPNILGSCYGTTGPVSINPETGRRYGIDFPPLTVRDIVEVQKALLDFLGVNRLETVLGSSLGGMQVLEWGVLHPGFCESIIPISTAAQQPAWCIALNAAARAAIMGDPAWLGGEYTEQPEHGLALARMVGMISYRSFTEFEARFGRTRQKEHGEYNDPSNIFAIESYLLHQGKKLADRFDANTYVVLSRATDLHDVAQGRGSVRDVLGEIKARTLAIGVSTDARYHTHLQKEIALGIPNARYREIRSIHGHDAFLIEYEQLNAIIAEFLKR
ncbi:MAG TPA: homoserine O-acetyltransferase [Bacteroidota bacterium]